MAITCECGKNYKNEWDLSKDTFDVNDPFTHLPNCQRKNDVIKQKRIPEILNWCAYIFLFFLFLVIWTIVCTYDQYKNLYVMPRRKCNVTFPLKNDTLDQLDGSGYFN